MVKLETASGAAARDAAAAAVAPPDEANDTGWDVLSGAFGGSAVERADVLGIAQRAIDRGGIDRDLCTGALLPAALAATAHGDRDLEARTAGELVRGWAVEHCAAQFGDQRVVVET